MLNSPTLAAAIESVERYLHIHNQAANPFFTVEGQQACFGFVLTDGGIDGLRQHNEYSLAVAVNTLRLMVGSNWVPTEVQFAHDAPVKTDEHLRAFRTPVLFGCATNALVIDRELVERQVPAADQRLYRILKQHVEHILNDMPRETHFSPMKGDRRVDARRRPKARPRDQENGDEPAHVTKTAHRPVAC